jgi:hypothetical protein
MRVPFADLSAQYQAHKQEFDAALRDRQMERA